jgi:xanthine dehydrogenase accessory factor
MHHWKETSSIVARLAALAAEGRRSALATVVRVEGSAYRRPGAKLLIVETGETLGSISGGCLEADVCEVALEVIATGRPVMRHYDDATDDIVAGLGLGCNGAVDIFVQPAADWPVSPLSAALSCDAPITLATDLATGATTLGEAGGRPNTFTEVLRPPLNVLVCGAGADTSPVAAYAAEVGFRVTVVDHRRPDTALPPPGRTLAIIMTHSFERDRDWLQLLLSLGVPYIGVLGPKRRTERMLEDGAIEGRVFAPVGLDIGAEGPQQIAISIVAELLAFVARRDPGHLRSRTAAIHVE